ncbi:MAG: VCBS repeat-containing protein, partial [Chloroflexi bacterium]|nr:VCBS repeat-containing protein [Chloroflexota bacterium]
MKTTRLRLMLLALLIALSGVAGDARRGLANETGAGTPPRGGGANYGADPYSDLVVGARYENVGAIVATGAANVLYGSAGGAQAESNQFWHQDSANVEGVAEEFDEFSFSLAVGDFNGDGYADLASGVPGEDVGADIDAGAVNILYGTAGGLSADGDQRWHQGSAGIEGSAEANDLFGHSLAAGDFNGDGYADLAIGVPGEDVGDSIDAGAVNVLYGTAAGL